MPTRPVNLRLCYLRVAKQRESTSALGKGKSLTDPLPLTQLPNSQDLDARALKDDTVHLLFDEARVLDGDRPNKPQTGKDHVRQRPAR